MLYKNPGPDKKIINDKKIIFPCILNLVHTTYLQKTTAERKRGHPLSMKQEKIDFSIVDIFFT